VSVSENLGGGGKEKQKKKKKKNSLANIDMQLGLAELAANGWASKALPAKAAGAQKGHREAAPGFEAGMIPAIWNIKSRKVADSSDCRRRQGRMTSTPMPGGAEERGAHGQIDCAPSPAAGLKCPLKGQDAGAGMGPWKAPVG